MINFRFHLVSLIAVFLALALGVVMGATVIDQAIVDGLNSRINSVEREADKQRSENSDLRDELDRQSAYVDETAGLTVANQLAGVPVAVVALRGSDNDAVTEAVALAQAAGAVAPGILWLEDGLVDEGSRQQLADVLGVPADASSVRAALPGALAQRLALGTDASTGDLLAALNDAGLVVFEPVGDESATGDLVPADYPGSDARVLLVDGSDVSSELSKVVTPLTRALAAASVPVVVAETFRDQEGGHDRGDQVAEVRSDGELSASVSTVDDLELVEGRVAAVLGLSDLGRGVIGHYGYGNGASRALPEAASA
jgi:hypothetical protein